MDMATILAHRIISRITIHTNEHAVDLSSRLLFSFTFSTWFFILLHAKINEILKEWGPYICLQGLNYFCYF